MTARLPLQIAYLTGQSDPAGAALSPAQEAFLDALPAPAECKVRFNFPYPASSPPHREMPILQASWNNGWQYLRSRRPEFAARYQPLVRPLLARAERTLFLAGSCGLELLANLDLPREELARVHAFAYGAVARRRPACEVRTVLARWDWVARLGARGRLGAPDARVAGDHLSYLGDSEVLALCGRYLREIAAGAVGSASLNLPHDVTPPARELKAPGAMGAPIAQRATSGAGSESAPAMERPPETAPGALRARRQGQA